MTPEAVDSALTLIAAVPGYAPHARRLRRAHITLNPALPDRAQASLRGHITLGPEPFSGDPDTARLSLAATLVHENHHLCQHPLLKTRSFWLGIATRTPPMRRYEAPAYAAQAAFLHAVARHFPALAAAAAREAAAVEAAFALGYGPAAPPPQPSPLVRRREQE